MTVALPTPDVTQFQAFTRGDEHALTAIFRQEYDALIARAQELLGPELAHCSPRIVQSAMLDTWRRRSELADPVGLASHLDIAVEIEAANQRRKHAALHHRPVAGTPVHRASAHRAMHIPSADDAIAELEATLHAPPPDHDALIEEARAAKRRHAQEHVQTVGRAQPWLVPALLGLAAIVIIVSAQYWVGLRGGEAMVSKALASADARDIASARGQRGTVTLGDESRARIGSESSVRVPPGFGGATLRTVGLTGTARFEVAEGRTPAFAVRAGDVDITAVGTTFSVRAYPGASGVDVFVEQGSVTVHHRTADAMHTVQAGRAVHVSPGGVVTALASGARDAAFAWTRDSLVLEDVPMREVVPQLVRWYDLKLTPIDAALADKRISVRLGLDSRGAALAAVAKAAGVGTVFAADDQVAFR